MKDCCERDDATSRVTVGTGSQRSLVEKFRGKFIREAQMIAGMDHPHIVRVLDVFEENGTAYYVMDYHPGGSLADLVKKEGPLSEAKAENYIRQVADALDYIHRQNTVHLDVKPSNILLNAKGEAILIDFGISKHYDDSGDQTSSTPVGISKGYAPLEQGRDGDISQFKPSTDIYALGATLYYLVSGIVPPEAAIVNEDGLKRVPSVSSRIWRVIEASMQPRRKERIQSIAPFLSLLAESSSEEDRTVVRMPIDTSTENTRALPNQSQPSSHSKTWFWAIISGIAIAVILMVILFAPKRIDEGGDSTVSGSLNGHEYVDLGLSVNWATCNVGASNPEEYGDYFAWGETVPKKDYNPDNYVFYTEYKESLSPIEEEANCYVVEVNINKYNQVIGDGALDYKYCLDLIDDAAYNNWGSTWRMPTEEEFDELVKKCSWKWIEKERVRGYLVTSKVNNNSIFLPAAGQIQATFGYEGIGYYWTSNLSKDSSTSAHDYSFISDDKNFSEGSVGMSRYVGLSIRPVTSTNEESIPQQLLEQQPSFNGGDANEFAKWVNSKLVYPTNAKENDVQGRVTLQFDVEADGSVTNVRVLSGVYESLDQEAVRVVSNSPKWKPGEYRGHAVKVTYTFPVIFQLK